ncbi:CsgG/HfaB family protein [Gaopeijia maritima]|uniref:CsgG/HfaB family protein n=1 Tax=Gaopeijia maritima TaxID=3119007 RepID=UPI00324CF8B0
MRISHLSFLRPRPPSPRPLRRVGGGASPRRVPFAARVGAIGLLLGSLACAGAPLRVSPDEIPALEAGLQATPDDAELRLRFAAALFSAGRCDDARIQAETAAALRPDNGVTPLIQGQCLEAEGELADAVDVYAGYLRQYADGEGADAVRGRLLLAQRTLAQLDAREALDREAELSPQAAVPGTVAILPVAVLGDLDDRFAGLSIGLAQMLVSDLSLLGDLRLVERTRVNALLGELALAESGRVDPATAARMGRLLRAADLVQGALAVDGSSIELDATVVGPNASTRVDPAASGPLQALLDLEKRLALALADRFSGPLTPAEERRILDNGPGSVDAFLAWADGLILEERGDFTAAADAYRQAVRLDPGFTEADLAARRAASASTVIGRSPTEVVGLGRTASQAVSGVSNPGLPAVLRGALHDVASLGPEVTLAGSASTGALWSPGADQPVPVLPTDVLLRILVRIPR